MDPAEVNRVRKPGGGFEMWFYNTFKAALAITNR